MYFVFFQFDLVDQIWLKEKSEENDEKEENSKK